MNVTERMPKIFSGENVGILGIAAGPCLLYLIRRYGYTTIGGDGYKEICHYVFFTKMETVHVHISITALWASFGISMQDETERNYLADELAAVQGSPVTLFGEEYTGDGHTLRDVEAAVDEFLEDLLRPVMVRDVAINVLGVVSEYAAADVVGASEFAGWGLLKATTSS